MDLQIIATPFSISFMVTLLTQRVFMITFSHVSDYKLRKLDNKLKHSYLWEEIKYK